MPIKFQFLLKRSCIFLKKKLISRITAIGSAQNKFIPVFFGMYLACGEANVFWKETTGSKTDLFTF